MARKAAHHAEPEGWLYHPRFPERWTRRPLYSLAQWVNGLAFRNIQFSESGKPVIKIAEIKDGITGQTKFTTQVFDESVHVTSGDLLFSWSGQPETSIDAFWWRGPDGWLNQHVFKVTPKPEIDRTFFFYLLRYLRPHFVAIARNKQTTGLGHVTKRDLEHIEAAYPALAEQRAIAAVLGALDDKIELNRRMCRTLEGIARAIFQAWFVDFEPVRAKAAGAKSFRGMPQAVFDTLPTAFADSPLGPIPKGWKYGPLPDFIDVNPARALRKGENAPYLDMANMPTRVHAPETWIQRPAGSGMRFINGDTLVARITPCLENGKTAYVDFLEDGQVGWGSTEYIVLRPKPPLPSVFAYCLARCEEFRSYAIQRMTGSSGRQRVPAESLKHFALGVPSEPVAQAFGNLADPLFVRSRVSMNQARALGALRDALLPKLVSGELRIRDVERIIGRCA